LGKRERTRVSSCACKSSSIRGVGCSQCRSACEINCFTSQTVCASSLFVSAMLLSSEGACGGGVAELGSQSQRGSAGSLRGAACSFDGKCGIGSLRISVCAE
jgi:hypothetical protein